MMLALALVALFFSIVVVGFLIAWHPKAHDELTETGPVVVDPSAALDFCEFQHLRGELYSFCGKPATHELVGDITEHHDGGSAMVSCFCAGHAPLDAVRVRTFAPR